jgi:hypothetical protein
MEMIRRILQYPIELKTETKILHKKSLCAENAEANSERNLYNPPSGLLLSFHVM